MGKTGRPWRQQHGEKALSVLDLHLDILSLAPPQKAMAFDYAKMINNIKRGAFEQDWHGKDGGFYEAAIFDFIGAMPLLRSDRPVAKAEWLKLGDLSMAAFTKI